MAFKPKNSNTTFAPRENFVMPVPEAGNQAARISLIVDLGIQERPDFEDPKTKEVKPQKPVQQLAVFADLVDNIVDYGGSIGEQPYRLILNKNFQGEVQGVAFTAVPPRDAEGNMIEGKLWTFHPANLLTKLAKATGQDQIIGGSEEDNMDVEQLLGQSLFIDVEVKQTESSKLDSKGEKIVYTNVRPKTYATVPKKKGVPQEVDDLSIEPMLITFDDVTLEQAKFIRADVRRLIKKATNYVGSKMQTVLEEYEASLGTGQASGKSDKAESKPKAEDKPKTIKSKEKQADDSFDDDAPFAPIGLMEGRNFLHMI